MSNTPATAALAKRERQIMDVLYRLGRALALMGISVRGARVVTLGAEAVDVFYLQDAAGRPLDDGAAREVVRLLTDAAA